MPGERFEGALREAFAELSSRDLAAAASNAGGSLSGKNLRVPVLVTTAVIDVSGGAVRWEDGSEPEDELKVILLHYVLRSDGVVDGRWESFREIKNGNLYYSVFLTRALLPLVARFGTDRVAFISACERLGGIRVERGSASYDLLIFPYLKTNVTLWEGDEEVAPSANILFDSAAGRHLGVEDLAHLAEWLVEMLARGE